MSETKELAAAEAAHGEKMVEISVRFFTDGIAPAKGKVAPKHVWAGGMIRMASNKAHGISADDPIPFNSLMEIAAVIEKVLIKHGITVHLSDRMTRYIEEQP